MQDGDQIRFTKMEGLGNDYIYVETGDPDARDWPRLARRMSDRHFGIGADGVILIAPSDSLDGRMVMFNADGSEGEMCGNGIRCVAKYLFDRRKIGREAVIETKAGPIGVSIVSEKPTRVRVDMGEPRLMAKDVPVALGDGDAPFSGVLPGADVSGRALSMGNPHFVTFWDAAADLPVLTLGPRLERHPAFPRRTNVEFAQVLDRRHIRLRVWERGSGETLACGTGAAATLVAAVLEGVAEPRATISLLGGDLEVEWDGHVFMTGPATHVFEGAYAP